MSSVASFHRNQLRIVHPARVIVALVPKAGNTSVRSAMHQGIAPDRPLKEFDDSIRIGKRISLNAPIPQDYTKIIMVRNPWTRLRSCYMDKLLPGRSLKHRGTRIGAGFENMGCRRAMPFEEFVEVVHRTPDALLEKHLMPVHYLLDNPNWGGVPDVILRLERHCDYVHMRVIFAEKNIILPEKMPRANNTDHKERPAFTPRINDLIAERYAKDIQLLGYEAPTC